MLIPIHFAKDQWLNKKREQLSPFPLLFLEFLSDYPNAKRMNPVAVKSLSTDFMY